MNNERIQQLYSQSLEEKYDYTASSRAAPGEYYSNYKTELNVEKFVNLLVQDCVEVCNRIYFNNYPDAEVWERSEEGDAIKKHFGVE